MAQDPYIQQIKDGIKNTLSDALTSFKPSTVRAFYVFFDQVLSGYEYVNYWDVNYNGTLNEYSGYWVPVDSNRFNYEIQRAVYQGLTNLREYVMKSNSYSYLTGYTLQQVNDAINNLHVYPFAELTLPSGARINTFSLMHEVIWEILADKWNSDVITLFNKLSDSARGMTSVLWLEPTFKNYGYAYVNDVSCFLTSVGRLMGLNGLSLENLFMEISSSGIFGYGKIRGEYMIFLTPFSRNLFLDLVNKCTIPPNIVSKIKCITS
ncbi:hypothetical protein IC006_0504 [Sulfuracidifex tepidarius]|uniref:Uncharacterized protein n=1 Tax=Sulfuracidifex tepidarius TaxID=1294262 RepID=A0A510DSV3_9CREN|nr:hypothetical protein [Sulfuracidifex tepidarius]BBG23220.1 hypothetical protein IC006_0504 [Sulfuracidifex tepidarius]